MSRRPWAQPHRLPVLHAGSHAADAAAGAQARAPRHPLARAGRGLLLGALVLLAACAGVADKPSRDVTTASDQTDAERRARTRLELASGYFGRGQFDVALDEVKRAIALAPGLADAYSLRALIYGGLGEDRLAEESFRQALALAPGDAGTLHNRGWFLCQRERFDEAQAQFRAALAVPQYRGYVRTMMASGFCHARAGDLASAEQALMKAYEVDPANPDAGFSLAEVLYRRQQYERARFYIGRVNDNAEAVNAQSLWLALRIEHRQGRSANERALGQQLRSRFPQSPEAQLYEGGRFDD